MDAPVHSFILSQNPQLLQTVITESIVGSKRVSSLWLSSIYVCFLLLFSHTGNAKLLIKSSRGRIKHLRPTVSGYHKTWFECLIYVCLIIYGFHDVCLYKVFASFDFCEVFLTLGQKKKEKCRSTKCIFSQMKNKYSPISFLGFYVSGYGIFRINK